MTSIDDVQDLSPRNQYVAAADQTEFDYTFPIFLDADLVVDIDGEVQVLTTDYTVSGKGNDTGGTVTLIRAIGEELVGGEVVTIYRDIAIARDTDIQQNGPWSSVSYNDEMDKVFLIMQELKNKVGRAIRFPITSASTNAQAEMAPISGFLGKFLRITSAGILEAAEALDNTVALSAEIIGELLNPQTDAELAAAVTPINYARFPTPIRDASRYISDNTGVTDISAEFQDAVDVTADELVFPDGIYLIGSSILLRNYSRIRGSGRNQQTVFKADAALAAPVITLPGTDGNFGGIYLGHFEINGNKTVATSTNIKGISLDNSTGDSGNKARNIIEHLTIRACAGDGMYLGARMRSSHVHHCVLYNNDGYGLRLATFSDSQIDHMDIGQSGLTGVYVTGTGMLHLDHIKSWFSEEHGFWFQNSSIIATGLESQESGERGFFLDNINNKPCILQACVSDADNRNLGGDDAMFLSDVNGAIIDLMVTNAAADGPVENAINLASDVYDCNIRLSAYDYNDRTITGPGIGSNKISINGRDMAFVEMRDDFLGDVIADQWTAFTGTDGQVVAPAIVSGTVGGEIAMVTGDDAAADMATNGVSLSTAPVFKTNAYGLSIEFRVKVSAITNVALFVGFTDQNGALEMPFTLGGSDALTSNATDACGILFDTAADTDNWWLVGVANDVDATKEDTAVAPSANTYETWRIVFGNGGAARFFRNGALIGSSMSGAVTATTALTPVVAAFSRGAASRTVSVDFINAKQLRSDY